MKTLETATTQPETPATKPANMPTPSAGAMRAASIIEEKNGFRPLVSLERVAQIIDRETAHAELVAALEEMVYRPTENKRARAIAALAKAKGQS